MKFPQKPNFKELFMSTGKIIGLLAIVVGVMFAIFGFDSAVPVNPYTDRRYWKEDLDDYFTLIFGCVVFVTGIFIFVKAKKQ